MATLVSNIGQTEAAFSHDDADMSQAFTTGSHATGYVLTGVDVFSSASSTAFTAWVCGVGTDGRPASPCTDLTAPTIAVGTNSFTAPAGTHLTSATTYAVVVSGKYWFDVTYGRTDAAGEDTGYAAGWSIADGAFSDNTESAKTVSAGGAVELTATARDPDGGSVTYAWSSPSGSFDATVGAMVTWTAPPEPGRGGDSGDGDRRRGRLGDRPR